MNEDIPNKVRRTAVDIVHCVTGINVQDLAEFPILPELDGRYRFRFQSWAVKIDGTIIYYKHENWGCANYTVKWRGKEALHCVINKFY